MTQVTQSIMSFAFVGLLTCGFVLAFVLVRAGLDRIGGR